MKLAIIGDGKMGQAIGPLAAARGHTVTAVLGSNSNRDGTGIHRDALGHPDVAIEVTEPGSAVANVLACARAGIPVVVGTTGWYDQLDTVIAEVHRVNGTLFWAPNFSIGVAVLSVAIEAAAKALRGLPGFDVAMVETHHAAKKDKPSGTAAALAGVAARALDREVPITSVRVGQVPGTHELVIDAAFDQIRLVHQARDRRLFAEGAISAAEWLEAKTGGGVFTMKDIFASVEDRR